MGQKANPIGLRLGIIKGWDSNWYGGKNFSDKLVEDHKIRNYLKARLAKASISKIVIERTVKIITVTINTSRPGIIIGKGGQEVDKIKEELKKITKKEIQINIFEIKRPELDARLVADSIARQIEGRVSFRRAVKMARVEGYKEGRTPLHTLRADIDYALGEAHTTYGRIGVKVWICKGEIYGKRDLSPNIGATAAGAKDKKSPAPSGNPKFEKRNNGGNNNRRGGNDKRRDSK